MMQRALLSAGLKRVALSKASQTAVAVPLRAFSNSAAAELTIDQKPLNHPEDQGVVFQETSIVPHGDAGTFAAPILVPSQHESRFVGYEDPDSHMVRWFELSAGHPHYIPDIGLYFQLQYVEPVY
mmetsp:Transcript_8363/g.11563  ORF Transcript_8363/g.11563 Transcript_8363/m.11563 type:complete len:125 (+) Transcript_8363:21-395(+)